MSFIKLAQKARRKFGGVVYYWRWYTPTKAEAEQKAKVLRKQGKSVRIVAHPKSYGGGWNVYSEVKPK